MDKIVGRFDVCQSTVLILQDAMDKVVCPDLNQPPLNMETDNNVVKPSASLEELTPMHEPELNVETLDLKKCHVCVTPLEDILFDKPDSKPKSPPFAESNDLPTGEQYTRSCTRKLQSHSNWIPRKASSGVQYGEPEEMDTSIKK